MMSSKLNLHINTENKYFYAFEAFFCDFLDFKVKNGAEMVKKKSFYWYVLLMFIALYSLTPNPNRQMLSKSSVFIGNYNIFKKFTCPFEHILP